MYTPPKPRTPSKGRATGYTDFYKTTSNPLGSRPDPNQSPLSRTAFKTRIEDEEEENKKKAIRRRLGLKRTR